MDNKDMKELMCLLDRANLSIGNNDILYALHCVNIVRNYLNNYHKSQVEQEMFYEKQDNYLKQED